MYNYAYHKNIFFFAVPAAPSNVTSLEAETTPTSIYVSWDLPQPVRGIILFYSLEYSSSVDNGDVNVTELSFNLTGLMEAVMYTITVYAHTDKGRGNGAVTMATTAEHCEL